MQQRPEISFHSPYYAPAPLWWGTKHWWPSSVCLSVRPMPDPKLRIEVPKKLKIVRREANVGDPWTPFRDWKVNGQCH